MPATAPALDYESLSDAALADSARRGHRGAFRLIMQRCNQRLFRIARAVVRDDSEAEDVVQESYARAFEKLASFRGEAKLITWLTSIVLNEARSRLRRRKVTVDIDDLEKGPIVSGRVIAFPSRFGSEDPAADVARAQFRRLLERAVDELPQPFRIVFVMREIEEFTVEETATHLKLRQETVKTRLHRARRLLRTALQASFSANLTDAFPFLGKRCDNITARVMAKLEERFAAAIGE